MTTDHQRYIYGKSPMEQMRNLAAEKRSWLKAEAIRWAKNTSLQVPGVQYIARIGDLWFIYEDGRMVPP